MDGIYEENKPLFLKSKIINAEIHNVQMKKARLIEYKYA